MLNSNPGLREITHSITGGALAAQGKSSIVDWIQDRADLRAGYWMPFDAAKAVAATFCYNIRYALTPVFGLDFLSLCVAPEDPRFGRMVIDRDIVQRCTEQATGFRLLSRESSVTSSPRTPGPSDEFRRKAHKSLRPKMAKSTHSESGYGTDTDRSDNYLHSPPTPSSSAWVALNTPRSVMSPQWLPQLPSQPVSPYPSQADVTYRSGDSSSSEENKPTKRLRSEEDEDYDDSTTSRSSASPPMPPSSKKKSTAFSKETRAAYMLMRMHMDDAKIDGPGSLSRRAST